MVVYLSIDRVCLALYAAHAAQHQHGTIQHAQCALHLNGEVNMAGRVDNVDVVARPLDVRGRRLDGNALLALQLHGVHLGTHAIAPLHLVHVGNAAGVEENLYARVSHQRRRPPHNAATYSLGQCRFAAINVRCARGCQSH